jgi:hypothetical protein
VEQFIPSDPSWKGWVKMALHQPLIPVLPVARELFTKTKWIARKGGHLLDFHDPSEDATLDAARRASQNSRRSFGARTHSTTSAQMVPSISEPMTVRTTSPDPMDVPQKSIGHQKMRRFLRLTKRNVDNNDSVRLRG